MVVHTSPPSPASPVPVAVCRVSWASSVSAGVQSQSSLVVVVDCWAWVMQALLDNAFTNYLTGANGYRYANGENYTVDIYVVMETGEQRNLQYLQSDWPAEIVDKYRPDGPSEDALENGIATTAEAVS